jgi:hypothetical protein
MASAVPKKLASVQAQMFLEIAKLHATAFRGFRRTVFAEAAN